MDNEHGNIDWNEKYMIREDVKRVMSHSCKHMSVTRRNNDYIYCLRICDRRWILRAYRCDCEIVSMCYRVCVCVYACILRHTKHYQHSLMLMFIEGKKNVLFFFWSCV